MIVKSIQKLIEQRIAQTNRRLVRQKWLNENSAAGIPANSVGDGLNIQPLTGDPIKKKKKRLVRRKPPTI
ncbi:MAG TPA: hypothetical protein VIY47_08365 [Ignavibacteriaceae bacterium]